MHAVQVDGAMRLVPIQLLDMDRLREELTVTVPPRDDDAPREYRLWRELGPTVCAVPRNYSVPWTGDVPHVVDSRVRGRSAMGYRSKVVPRPNQEEALSALLRDHEDKILCLGCGRGKTVVSLHAACVGKRLPVLIVVPTSALDAQWRREIAAHTTCPPWMIGTIRGPVIDVEGKPFTVAMLKTVSLKELPKWVYEHFSLVIFDEGHRMGAPLLGRCAGRFFGERWTLTATPEREDGLDVMFRPHLGNVVLRDTRHELRATVYVVRTGVRINEAPYRAFGSRLGRLYNMIAAHEERNRIVLSYVKRALQSGRTPLVLGERVEQLRWFVRELGYDKARGVPVAGLFCGGLVDTARERVTVNGKRVTRKVHWRERPSETQERKERALTRRVLCATSILGKEGLDKASLDTAIIPTPFGSKGRLDQTVGRVLRELRGKKRPLAFVFLDESVKPKWAPKWGEATNRPGFFAKLTLKMVDHARELGYEVKVVDYRRSK